MSSNPPGTAAAHHVGARVVVPGGRTGTVVGVKTVYVQLDDVGSRNSVDVERLTEEPKYECVRGFSSKASCPCGERGHWSDMDSEFCVYGPYKCKGVK